MRVMVIGLILLSATGAWAQIRQPAPLPPPVQTPAPPTTGIPPATPPTPPAVNTTRDLLTPSPAAGAGVTARDTKPQTVTVTPGTRVTRTPRRARVYGKKALSRDRGSTVRIVAPYGTVGSDDFKDHPVISGVTGYPWHYRRYYSRRYVHRHHRHAHRHLRRSAMIYVPK